MPKLTIYHSDNLAVLKQLPDKSVDLIYIDPPFNTGKVQTKRTLGTVQNDEGDRTGFGGNRYETIHLGTTSFSDVFTDYLGFLEPRLREAHRILSPSGSLFFHIDPREAHYCKVLLDQIFGRPCFMNEIIWAYDFGARTKSRWPSKHQTLFWYAKDPKNYTFNYDKVDRVPYLAPDLVGEEKAKRGKTVTSVWWNSIVGTNSKEKTGYATQKPLAILDRIARVHSNPGNTLMDFFAGSGTFGIAAVQNKCNCILVDSSLQAVNVMRLRLMSYSDVPGIEIETIWEF